MGEMRTEVMNITPEMAERWLELNLNNRVRSPERENAYARAMLSGNWTLTHQGIAFRDDGTLLDGQTRLHAIVKAGIPVKMNVTFGVECANKLLEVDTGRVRSYRNVMQISGETDKVFTTMNGVVREFILRKVGGARPTIMDIHEYIKRHYNEVAYIAECFHFTGNSEKTLGWRHAPSIVAAAGLSALYGHENRDAIKKFGDVWCDNDVSCAGAYNTKIALDTKERVRNMRASEETFKICENAIRCFANNIRLMRVIDCYQLDKEYAR